MAIVGFKVAVFNSMHDLQVFAAASATTIYAINRDDANNQWVLWYA